MDRVVLRTWHLPDTLLAVPIALPARYTQQEFGLIKVPVDVADEIV